MAMESSLRYWAGCCSIELLKLMVLNLSALKHDSELESLFTFMNRFVVVAGFTRIQRFSHGPYSNFCSIILWLCTAKKLFQAGGHRMCSDIRVSNLWQINWSLFKSTCQRLWHDELVSEDSFFFFFLILGIHNRRRYRGLELTFAKEKGHFFCSQNDFTFSTGKLCRKFNICHWIC